MEYEDIKIGQVVVTNYKNKWVTAKVQNKNVKCNHHTKWCVDNDYQNSHNCYCASEYQRQIYLKVRGRKSLLIKDPADVYLQKEYLPVGSVVLTHVRVDILDNKAVNLCTSYGDEYKVPILTFLLSLSDSYGNMLFNKKSLSKLLLEIQTKDWVYLKVRVAKISKNHLNYTLMPATDKKLHDNLMPFLGETPCSALFHAVVKPRRKTKFRLNGTPYKN